jgi:hypothetical protein
LRILGRIFGFFFGIIRTVVWAVGLLVIGVFIYFYIAARPIPRETLNKLLIAVGTDTDAVDARHAAFGLREGLILSKVRILPKGVVAPEWFSADELRISGSVRPDRAPREWIESVVAHRLQIASIPSFTSAGSSAGGASATTTNRAPLVISPMRIDLVDASFLNMRFKRIQALLRQEKDTVVVDNAKIEWPSDRGVEEVAGTIRMNPVTGLIEGQLNGALLPDRIYPLLQMLQARGVLDIAHRFVFGLKPVEVEARFRVAPAEPHYELRLTLALEDCLYDGVPLKKANAMIVAEGTNDLTHITVQPLVCERPDGKLSGSMTIDTITSNMDFIAQSDLPVTPLLRLIRVDIDPARYDLTFPTSPRLTATGRVPLDGNLDGIVINGTYQNATTTVRRVPLQNLQCDFGIVTNSYNLRNIRTSAAGSDVSGTFSLFMLPGPATQASYRTSLQFEHLDVETFAIQLGFTNYPIATAKAEVSLASRFGDDHAKLLNGEGSVRLENGQLGRVPLFAGLTGYMARHVPGVEFLVSQTQATIPFVITNGMLYTDKVQVEGDVFNITGAGTYHFPNDNLDVTVRASVFKRTTWLGRIVQAVTFPFSKLLMEFRARGSLGNPNWEYRGVLERIVDSVSAVSRTRRDDPS